MSSQDVQNFETLPSRENESKDLLSGENGASADNEEYLRLKEENKILRTRSFDILECTSEAFFTLDEAWRFSYANLATGRLLNRPPEDLLGKSIWKEYPGLIGSNFEPVYRRGMENRRESRITEYYPDHRRWYEVNVFPASKGITVYFKDVTGQKKSEVEIEKLSALNQEILESITDGFFALDDAWRFTYVNRQATQILDKTPAELIGKSIFEVYTGLPGTEFEHAYRRTAAEGVTSTFTAYYPDHGRWYEVNAYPAPNGITVYFRNATERMRAEQELREADKKKDEFLATLAHELRNPLAPVRSGLEIIRRLGNGSEQFTETLAIVERQTAQIVHLVDDLLDISRISQGKIRLKKKRIELKTVIDMALETSRSLVDEAANELTITLPEKPIFLDADLTRAAQIILNVLNNAAKYSDPGGKISLTASRDGGEAVISIKDTGLGIKPAMLSKIFEMFGQISTPDEQARGGLGIGLSVVKKLVELHDGGIQVFSEGIGKGSEFIIRLPLAAEQSQIMPAGLEEADIRQRAQMNIPESPVGGATETKPQARGYRILVVDDNQDAAEMLETLLSMNGHIVRTAYDAPAGLEIVEEFQPEICLCDIGLPGMNGYELAVHLRRLLPHNLLVSISGWGQEEDRRQSKESGFDYHLVKPVQFDDLLRLIRLKSTGELSGGRAS